MSGDRQAMTRGAPAWSLSRETAPARSCMISAFAPVAAGMMVLAAGCGGAAWRPATEFEGGRVLAGLPVNMASPAWTPYPGIGLPAAIDDPTGEFEGAVPRIELFIGGALMNVGDKLAGHDGAAPPDTSTYTWGEAFDRGMGFDVQIVLARPRRPAQSLAAGDTFFVLRGSYESYSGLPVFMAPLGIFATSEGLTLIGAWFEGRTLLNPLDAARSLRPYLQYGGGLVMYNDVTFNGLVHWQRTLTMGWKAALGVEYRRRKLGLYIEGGVQAVGPPDVDVYYTDPDDIDTRTAQHLVTYPLRVGLMVGF